MSLFGITPYFRVTSAIAFVNSISDTNNNYYIGLSRISQWDSPNSDVAPPDIILNQDYYHEIKRSCFGIKKITISDVCLGIKRYDWSINTLYTQYDENDVLLNTKNFYVMTSEYKVFKCLFNNNNALSTVMPTESVQETGDGYIWKYMFTVNVSDRTKFLTNTIIPIRPIVNTYTEGQIDVIQVTNGGSNYTSTPTVTIKGNGKNATIDSVTKNPSNQITHIKLNNKGIRYTYATVEITGGGGTGATANAIISPDNGHTSDIFYELFAYYVIIRPSIEYSESNVFIIDNNFRQAFIIKDPLDYSKNKLTNDKYYTTTRVTLSSIGPTFTSEFNSLNVDDIINISTGTTTVGTARIAYKDTVNTRLHLVEVTSPDINDLNILTSPSNYQFTISGGGTNLPTVQVSSGKILYILNREPINRSSSQIESFYIPIIF